MVGITGTGEALIHVEALPFLTRCPSRVASADESAIGVGTRPVRSVAGVGACRTLVRIHAGETHAHIAGYAPAGMAPGRVEADRMGLGAGVEAHCTLVDVGAAAGSVGLKTGRAGWGRIERRCSIEGKRIYDRQVGQSCIGGGIGRAGVEEHHNRRDRVCNREVGSSRIGGGIQWAGVEGQRPARVHNRKVRWARIEGSVRGSGVEEHHRRQRIHAIRHGRIAMGPSRVNQIDRSIPGDWPGVEGGRVDGSSVPSGISEHRPGGVKGGCVRQRLIRSSGPVERSSVHIRGHGIHRAMCGGGLARQRPHEPKPHPGRLPASGGPSSLRDPHSVSSRPNTSVSKSAGRFGLLARSRAAAWRNSSSRLQVRAHSAGSRPGAWGVLA